MTVAHGDVVGPGAMWAWSAGDWLPALPAVVVLSAVGRSLARRGRSVVVLGAAALVLAVSIAGPLERLSGTLLAAHMLQHALLLSVVAPLLALAVPPRLLPALLPAPTRQRIRRLLRAGPAVPGWGSRAAAVALVTVVAWAWHAPAPYEAAAADDRLHAVEHVTFLVAGVAFWWAVFGGRLGGRGTGAGLLVLVAGTVPVTALGALLAFAEPVYERYAAGAAAWGFTPQEDQTLGAMVMWAIGGLAAVTAAALMTVSWLDGRAGTRADLERAPTPAPSRTV